jgi:hypothetical protein
MNKWAGISARWDIRRRKAAHRIPRIPGRRAPNVARMLAEDLDGYLRARAAVEGVSYNLNPEIFTGFMRAGVASYFGVDVDLATGVLVRDRQEPRPGFFEAWLESKKSQPEEAA